MKIYPSNMNHLRYTKPSNEEILEQYNFPCSITVLNQTTSDAEVFYYDGDGIEFSLGKIEIPQNFLIKNSLSKTDAAPTETGLYPLKETGVYPNLGNIDAVAGKLNFASFDGTTWSLIAADLPQPIVNNYTNNNTYNLDPEQIVPSEALYNDETLAGDILKRVEKTTGENVNYREITTWYDGSAMDDSKVDGFNFIKLNNKYYNRIEPLENESSLYLNKGKRILKATEKLEYRQKIILSISINSLQSGNLQLFLNNRFSNVEISNSDDVSSIYNKIKNSLWYATVTIVNSEIEIIMPENGYFRFDILEKPNGLTYSFNRINENLTTKTLFVEKDYISKDNYTYIITKDVDLQGEILVLPANSVLKFDGGTIKNGEIKGNNTTIIIDYNRDVFDNIYFTGTFKKSSQLFFYKTMQEIKENPKSLFPCKMIKTLGFWFEYDNGGGVYEINTDYKFSNEFSGFESFYNGTTHNGLFVNVYLNSFGTKSALYAKLISTNESLNLSHFGVKYDAKFYDVQTRKWYTDNTKTTLATDNYSVFSRIGYQLHFFGSKIYKNVCISDVLVVNSKVEFVSTQYSYRLYGNGYVAAPVSLGIPNIPLITSNADLDVIFDFKAVGFDLILENVSFFGCDKRIKNGILIRNGGEVESIKSVVASDFENAGMIWLGMSSSFKIDTCSFFHNRVGLLLTNKNPFDNTEVFTTIDRIMSGNRVSGDSNSSALIEIDEGNSVYGSSINFRDVKCEGIGDAAVKIVTGHVGVHIKIDGITFYPNNSPTQVGINNLIQIESTVNSTPTIELSNYVLAKNGLNHEIVDKKNNKIISFPTSFKSAPHIIYTDDASDSINGFIIYRNGIPSNYATTRTYGTSSQRPIIPSTEFAAKLHSGYMFYDETLNKPIFVKAINPDNSIIWVDANGNNV